MKNRLLALLIRFGVIQKACVYYIGGTDVLPPPLKGAD